ncbi:hypothetical protein [Desulfovibrio sp.]|uniref:hypothetical protein n=1 Tax=Desulfovibrio sp. TaxID=885 RepID=UPI0023D7ABD6|nr:hypothetical protein [Desulfovibrio sp.]MDE7241471.1 hypothetical protein [Desulfovibrio sp.]
MIREKVLQMLLDSAPEDWIVHDMGDGRTVSVYTPDPRLWIINDPTFGWQPNTDTASWLPSPDAWYYMLPVMYGCSLVFLIVVSVDGGAGGGDGGMAGACLPCPRPTPGPGRQTVPTISHKIVKVGVPDNGRLEEYLDRYRLEVEDDEDRDEDWPWDWENYARACEEVRRREYLKAWEEAQRLLDEADALMRRELDEADALMRRERDREFERKCRELAEAYARMCDEVDKEYARLREEEAQEQEGEEQCGPTPGSGM